MSGRPYLDKMAVGKDSKIKFRYKNSSRILKQNCADLKVCPTFDKNLICRQEQTTLH